MVSTDGKPFLQIVRGDATPEEVAALVAVLTARARSGAGAAGDADDRPVSRWADRSRLVRDPAGRVARPAGPGAWRASALPR